MRAGTSHIISFLASAIRSSADISSFPNQSRIRMMQSASSTAMPSGFSPRALISHTPSHQSPQPSRTQGMELPWQCCQNIGRLARYSSNASDSSLWHRAMISPKVRSSSHQPCSTAFWWTSAANLFIFMSFSSVQLQHFLAYQLIYHPTPVFVAAHCGEPVQVVCRLRRHQLGDAAQVFLPVAQALALRSMVIRSSSPSYRAL